MVETTIIGLDIAKQIFQILRRVGGWRDYGKAAATPLRGAWVLWRASALYCWP